MINYRGGWLVADAAANAVLRVSSTGVVSLFRTFPNVKTGPCANTRIKGDTRTHTAVPFPAGVAVDAANRVYVSVFSVFRVPVRASRTRTRPGRCGA